MKITIRRSGGFAGITSQRIIDDTASLAPDQQAAVRAALTTLQQTAGATPAVGADFERYEVSVDDAGKQRTYAFVDDGSAPSQQLIRSLMGT